MHPRPSSILQRIKPSWAWADGCITFRADITFSVRRECFTNMSQSPILSHHSFRVSTLRSAIELKSVFDQIQAAEKNGNLSPEEKRKLEEQAAEKGLQALFKVLDFSLNHSLKSSHPLLTNRARSLKSSLFSARHANVFFPTQIYRDRRHN
jgi:hypothetical protein